MIDKSKFSSQVLLLVGTSCQHCAPVMSSLSELVKEGVIDSLEVINVEKKPELAVELGVKSVPWLRIGWFELEGARSKTELKRWVENISAEDGAKEYYAEILAQGRVKQCISLLHQYPDTMSAIISLMSDPDEKINVRLGVGVILEEYAPSSEFESFIPELAAFLQHEDSRLRIDACHYLSLTQKPDMIELIKPLLEDVDGEVREEAEESIEVLNEDP